WRRVTCRPCPRASCAASAPLSKGCDKIFALGTKKDAASEMNARLTTVRAGILLSPPGAHPASCYDLASPNRQRSRRFRFQTLWPLRAHEFESTALAFAAQLAGTCGDRRDCVRPALEGERDASRLRGLAPHSARTPCARSKAAHARKRRSTKTWPT